MYKLGVFFSSFFPFDGVGQQIGGKAEEIGRAKRQGVFFPVNACWLKSGEGTRSNRVALNAILSRLVCVHDFLDSILHCMRRQSDGWSRTS